MSEVLSRIFPAVRDVRTPLIVGLAWFAVLGFVLGLQSRESITAPQKSSDPVVKLLVDVGSPLPSWVIVGAIALGATIVGSGIVRLMDRMRQAFRYPSVPEKYTVPASENHDEYSDLIKKRKESQPALIDNVMRWIGRQGHRMNVVVKKEHGTKDSPLDRDRSYLVLNHVRSKAQNEPARREWGGPEDAPEVFDDDLRLFLFHLARDERFDGYNDQQLLRFSLIPPIGSAAVVSIAWLFSDWAASKLLLSVILLGFVTVLYFDRFRLRSLLIERWQELADEYPTWLPDAAVDRRNLGRERVREILHGDAGLRSVTAHQQALGSADPADLAGTPGGPDSGSTLIVENERRLRILRATSTQIRLSGAPKLSSALDRILRAVDVTDDDFDAFYVLAARWSGSRIEYCSERDGQVQEL